MDQIFIDLTKNKLEISKAIDFVSSPNCGAISIFMGTTRINEINETNSVKQVSSLYYEAYEEMALEMIRKLVNEILLSSDDSRKHHKIFVCHRLGQVSLGEASIIIAVSSPHRVSSQKMVMDILEKIKQQVPIWKKVFYQKIDEMPSNIGYWSENSEAFWLHKNH